MTTAYVTPALFLEIFEYNWYSTGSLNSIVLTVLVFQSMTNFGEAKFSTILRGCFRPETTFPLNTWSTSNFSRNGLYPCWVQNLGWKMAIFSWRISRICAMTIHQSSWVWPGSQIAANHWWDSASSLSHNTNRTSRGILSTLLRTDFMFSTLFIEHSKFLRRLSPIILLWNLPCSQTY